VAVYDLGGGTFDTVVLQMGPDGSFAVRGQPEGVERLGGVDVDAAVLGHVLRALGPAAEAALAADPDDPATVIALAQLRRDCVEAKEALSSETSVAIPVLLPQVRGQVLLQRRELEDLIAPLLAPTTDALARVVASAGLTPAELDAVLLVGGASRTPLVAREVTEALGRPVAVDAHPKHPVALGAAMVAAARAPTVPLAPPPRPDSPVVSGAAAPTGPGPASAAAGSAGMPPPPPPVAPGAAAPVSAGRPRTARRAVLAVVVAAVLVAAALGVARLATGDGGSAAEVGGTGGGTTAPSTEPQDDAQPHAGAQLAWTVALDEETISELTTDGRRVYVEDSTGRVTAVNVASGRVDWQANLGQDGSGVSPLVAGDVVVASASEPLLAQALDKDTGAVRWTVPDLYFFKQPVPYADTVVVSSGDAVEALALADGKVRWQTPVEDNLWTGLVAAGETLVAGTSNGKVVGLNAATGQVRFVTPVPRGDLTIWAVAVVGRTALARDDDGDVTGISVDTGQVLWTLRAHAKHPGSIAALGPDAAIWLESGELLVVDPATGKERRRLRDGANAMLALPGEPPLLVVAGGGSLRALRPDAKQAWSADMPVQGLSIAASRGVLAVSDYEGNVSGYRVTT
jgi:outer membrane protein assembly factor BamB